MNDHAPQFEHAQYEASVREGVSVGSTVITVRATDQDAGRNAELEYSLATNNSDDQEPAFRIDPRYDYVFTTRFICVFGEKGISEILSLNQKLRIFMGIFWHLYTV